MTISTKAILVGQCSSLRRHKFRMLLLYWGGGGPCIYPDFIFYDHLVPCSCVFMCFCVKPYVCPRPKFQGQLRPLFPCAMYNAYKSDRAQFRFEVVARRKEGLEKIGGGGKIEGRDTDRRHGRAMTEGTPRSFILNLTRMLYETKRKKHL